MKAERNIAEDDMGPIFVLGKNSACEVAFFEGKVASLEEDLRRLTEQPPRP